MTIAFRAASSWSENNTWYTTGTNPISVTKPSGTAENDFLIAFGRQNNDANVTDLVSNGWTVLVDDNQAGNSGFFAYKIAGASEPASYEFTTNTAATGNDAWVTVAAYSGVDTANPLDVTFVEADHFEKGASTSTTHATPAIASRSTNAWVLSLIQTNEVTGGPNSWTEPSGYTLDESDGNENAPGGAIAHKALTAPATETPGNWTLGVTSGANLMSLVLRDTDATYIEISDVTFDPPTGHTYVQYRGDVIPEDSILHLHRGSHTGSSGSATLTDSAKSLSANEWQNYEVYNFTDGSTGIIDAHSSGTGPHSLSTALAGGNDNDFDNGDSYDIRVPMASGDQIGYETNVDSASGSVTFDYYLVDATDGSISSTVSAIMSLSGLASGKTGTIAVDRVGQPTYTVTGDAVSGSAMSAILGDNVLGDNVLGDISAGTDATAPTVSSAAIDAAGTSLTITHSEAVDFGSGGNGGFALSTGQTLTYSSGSGTAALVYTISPAVEISESPTLAYTQPGDGVEDAAGNDLLTFTGQAITNNSIVGISASPGGTVVGAVQSLITDTGATLTITLANDTWIAADTGPIGTTAQSDAIVDGITSAQAESGGWNDQIRDVLDQTDLARTSDTVATLTIPATAGYSITADEVITATIPNAVLTTSTTDVVASTFTIKWREGTGGPVIHQRRNLDKMKKKKRKFTQNDQDEDVAAAIAQLFGDE